MADTKEPINVEERFKQALGTQASRAEAGGTATKSKGEKLVNFIASGGWIAIVVVAIVLVIVITMLVK